MYLANNDILKQVRGFDINKITADMHREFKAGIAQDGAESNRVLSVAEDAAVINISGVLTKAFTFMTWILGGTAYDDISGALALAERDDEIQRIKINMNSGGGQVAGLFDLIAQMQTMSKPIECFVSGMCCSAAYAIASQCDTITASSDGETLGSVGIVVDMYVDESEVSVTSTNAPKKRPNATTEEGVADIRAELDQYEELFIEAIASGRGTTVEQVISDYGQGATMTARNALKYGMIDSIKSVLNNNQGVPDSTVTASNEEPLMNIAELKAKHPDLYAEVLAQGETSGKQSEKERVAAFVELGAASGATDLMMACIKDGTEHSATVTARFSAAQMTNMQLAAMSQDNPDVSGLDTEQPEGQEQVSASEKAALDLAAQMGVEING